MVDRRWYMHHFQTTPSTSSSFVITETAWKAENIHVLCVSNTVLAGATPTPTHTLIHSCLCSPTRQCHSKEWHSFANYVNHTNWGWRLLYHLWSIKRLIKMVGSQEIKVPAVSIDTAVMAVIWALYLTSSSTGAFNYLKCEHSKSWNMTPK